MTRKLLLPLVAILSLLSPYVSAQPKNPVAWSTKVTGDQVLITAKTDSPWHMYDLGPYTDGPNATTFHFELPQGVTLRGTIVEKDKPQRKMDEVFGMPIGVYGPVARFVQQFN
ncbi:MAG: thiol:disulfide interchange protein, partial [Mucinivorans sp.]